MTETPDGWIDPRPQLPPFYCTVEVYCDDGSIRKAALEDTWDGPRWRDGGVSGWIWSAAHPNIIGWRELKREKGL